MSQTRPNKIVTITNDEIYDLATHQARLADSARVVIPVSSQTERDGLAALFGGTLPSGTPVCRLDLLGHVQVWDGAKWGGPPRGELSTGSTGGVTSTGTALNVPYEVTLTLEPNRRLRLTAQIEGSSNTAGLHIAYYIKVGGTGTGGNSLRSTTKRYNVATLGEGVPEFSARYTTGAGGSVRFSIQAQVVETAGIVTHGAGAVTLSIDDTGAA